MIKKIHRNRQNPREYRMMKKKQNKTKVKS